MALLWACRCFDYVSCVQPECLNWLPSYRWKEQFVNDLIAGVTVFMFVVSSSPAFGILAGLPAAYGLYTSTVSVVVYCLLGGSRQVAVGPTTVTSLVLGSSTAVFGYPVGSDAYVQIALNIAMLSGIISYVVGICRGGALVNFLGPTVLSGFLTAVAMTTFLTQIKSLLGLDIPPSLYYNFEKIVWLLMNLPSTNVYSFAIGLLSSVFLYGVKTLKQTCKATPGRAATRWYRLMRLASNAVSIVALVIGGVVGYLSRGPAGDPPFAIVGMIPVGLQAPNFRFIGDFGVFLRMLPLSAALFLVNYTAHWSVALRFAAIHDYVVDADQELMAVGLSNIFGTLLVNSITSGGGLGRSAINDESGAVTQMAMAISAALTVLVLFFLAPLFYYVPLASLGAVVVTSVLSMMDFRAMVFAYRTDKRDFVVIVLTFLVTFLVGIVEGIILGMLLSFAFVLKTSAFPEIVTLGVVPGTVNFKDVKWYPECEQIPGVAIVRMDATLYFANTAHFKTVVHDAALGLFHTSEEPIRYVVLDVGAWADLDIAAINTLSDIHAELLKIHVQLAFAHAKYNVHAYLLKIKFIEKIGGDSYVFSSVADAVDARPAREKSIDDEVAVTVAVREEEVRSASAAAENVLYGDGLRVLDDDVHLSRVGRASPSAASRSSPTAAARASPTATAAVATVAWGARGAPVLSPLMPVEGVGVDI